LVLRRLKSVLFAVQNAATFFFKSASLYITTDILRTNWFIAVKIVVGELF
jgi:hypothetical protein